jgi:hypothetical protein
MTDEHDAMLTETIARHFDRAKVSGDTVDVGVAELFVRCRVSEVRASGAHRTASLFFHLWGGGLGEHPLFASMTGYGTSVEEAVIGGGCLWACTFGPVLTSALADAHSEQPTTFDAVLHGRPVRVVVDGLDRAVSYDGSDDSLEGRTQSARERFGAAPWLVPKVIDSGTLPVLPADRATLLSVFTCDSKDMRVLEVKVNGQDWPPSQRLLDDVPPSSEPGVALLRELAVIVPKGPAPPLARGVLEPTLAGAVAEPATGPRPMVTWPGWLAHRGRFAPPASDARLRALESDLGPLPAPYRAFVATIAHAGAGPGYGLLSPFIAAQAALARGEFSWRDGDAPHGAPGGVLALAHAGCGIMWLLVLTGRHGGEVWVDLRSTDGCVRRVAGTFDEWYRDWVDALVRDAPLYAQWDGARCATASVLVQMLEALQREGLSLEAARRALPTRIGKGTTTLRSGDSAYFANGATLDPCEPCTRVVTDLGISADTFSPGTPPLEGSAVKKPGLLRRIATALRGDDT